MVNNWQCFKRSQSQVVYKKPGDILSSSRQGLRFQFLFCLSSFLTHDFSDLRRKSLPVSPLFSRPIWYSPDGVPSYHPHSPSSPPSVPLSFPLTEPSDLLQRPLLNMDAILTAARTRLYRGCVQDCNLPEHTPCEASSRLKIREGRL